MSVPVPGQPAPWSSDTAELEPIPPPSSWYVDIAMAFVLGCMLSLPMYGTPFALATSIVMTTSLVLRSNLPRAAMILCTAGALGQVVLVATPTPAIMVVPVIVYSVARWSTIRWARITLAVAVFGAMLGPGRWLVLVAGPIAGRFVNVVPALVISVFGCMGMVAAAYALGRRRRESVMAHAQRMAAAMERTRHQRTERDQQIHLATVRERQRIATELHDIVAHSLSVIVVQAEGGKAIAAKRPEAAPQVLETIAETSRDALGEMRRIVGLLRTGGTPGEDDEDTYVPTPGLTDLPELVRKTGNAELVTRGGLPQVSQALGLTAYRVVQESLTNVLKHGGPGARATVMLTTLPDRLVITVADDGRGAASAPDGNGNGLRGMRERLAVHGGTLDARPRPDGGFTVRAVLPLDGRVPPAAGPAATGEAARPSPHPTHRAPAPPRTTPHRPVAGPPPHGRLAP